MKKIIFLLLILLVNIEILLAENFTVIRGQVLEYSENFVKILDMKSNKKVIIKGKFPEIKKGEFVKIFIDKKGNIDKIKKINLKSLRERIKKIGKIKNRYRHRGNFRGHNRRKR